MALSLVPLTVALLLWLLTRAGAAGGSLLSSRLVKGSTDVPLVLLYDNSSTTLGQYGLADLEEDEDRYGGPPPRAVMTSW